MKYMILMNATAAGLASFGTMSKEDFQAHVGFMLQLNKELEAAGELVDAKGLGGPHEAKMVRAREGGGAPIVTDGPFGESKEFLAGFWILDVRDEARIIEIAARISTAPGKGGVPLNFPVEVRPIPEQKV
ncbi:MAG: hypothetical protein BGO98_12560 [Myxococcales bacterium 68-20]|nr:MAG: hypothetical protein BGO98_12560 [Myxococcales bacterium 68-20]